MSNTSIESNQLSSKEAGRILGYTHDYISKLCREGKMSGIQKGRVWYVTKQEVEDFQVRHQAELEKKKVILSKKFSQMRSKHTQEEDGENVAQNNAQIRQTSQISYQDDESVPSPLQLKFQMPKQIMAAAVLGFLVLGFSFLNAPVQNTQVATQTTSPQTASINTIITEPEPEPETEIETKTEVTSVPVTPKLAGGIVPNIDQGIATVIGAQSELFLQTANAFSFLQYLSDGYWQLTLSFTDLSKATYQSLQTISDGVLTVYQLQGIAVYQSIGAVADMGTVALSVYELAGKAVLIGSQNTLASYQDIFGLSAVTQVASMHANVFTSNVTEGFSYYTQGTLQGLGAHILLNIGEGLLAFGDNLRSNFNYVSGTLAQSREYVGALIINALSVDLSGSKDSVRKIEVK